MTLLRRSFTPPSGPDLHSVGNYRFEVVLPGRSSDWLNLKYSARNLPEIQLPQKPRRSLPASVVRGGVSPNVQRLDAPLGDNKASIRPKSACLPSRSRDCHNNFVPQPPSKAWGGAVRPSTAVRPSRHSAHERLHGGSARGVATRAAVRRAVAGDDIGKSRWSDLKVLYTQLVDAINGDCIPSLLSSIAQVEAAGMFDWPEYSSALARLSSLQDLMSQLEAANVSADISEVQRALDAAILLRAGPAALASGTTWALQDAVKCRLEKFRETEDELKRVANGSSIPALVQALRCARDLGVNSCPQAQLAEIRLKVLNAAHRNLCAALGGENLEDLLSAEASAVNLEVNEQSDLPLGSLLSAVRQRLRKREQDIAAPQDLKPGAEHLETSDVGTEVESTSRCSSKYVADVCKEVDVTIERMVDAEVHSTLPKGRRLDEQNDDLNSFSPSEIMQKEARALLANVMLEDLASGVFDDMDLEQLRTEGDTNAGPDKRHTPDLYQQSTRDPSTTPGLSESMFNQSGRNSASRPESSQSCRVEVPLACRPDSSRSYRAKIPPKVVNDQVGDALPICRSAAVCRDSEEASAIMVEGCDGNDAWHRNGARDDLFLLVCQAVRSVADVQPSDASSEATLPPNVQTCG